MVFGINLSNLHARLLSFPEKRFARKCRVLLVSKAGAIILNIASLMQSLMFREGVMACIQIAAQWHAEV